MLIWNCSPLRATINLGLWHILHGNANKIHQITNFSTKTSFHKNCNWSIFLREVTLSFRFFFNDCHFIHDCKFFNMPQIWLASPLQQPTKMPQSSQLVVMQYFTMCNAHTPGVWPTCTFYLFGRALYWTHLPILCLQLAFLGFRAALCTVETPCIAMNITKTECHHKGVGNRN